MAMHEMVKIKPPKKPDFDCIILRDQYVAMVQEDGSVLVPKDVAEEENTLAKLGMGKTHVPKTAEKKGHPDVD